MNKNLIFCKLGLIVLSHFIEATCCAQAPNSLPKINITHYISEYNNHISANSKFVVLEFWATWCAPCLAALPHLNKLQTEFRRDTTISFISMTSEQPDRVRKILSRFHFESAVVCDTTGKTEKEFGVTSIPATFIIDSKGNVRWKGLPRELNSKVIHDVISDIETQKPVQETELTSNKVSDDQILYTKYRKLFDEFNKENYFEISFWESTDIERGASSIGEYVKVFKIGVSIRKLLSELLKSSVGQVILPSELKDKSISYIMISKRSRTDTTIDKSLLEKMMSELKLEYLVKNELSTVMEIGLENKLELAKHVTDGPYEQTSSDKTAKIVGISNGHLSELLLEMNNVSETKVSMDSTILNSKKYSITLDLSTFKALSNSLHAYGLMVKRKKALVPKYYFYRN